MVQILKITAVFIFLASFTTTRRFQLTDCDKVSVSARGQYVQIKCGGCEWVRIEYTTTNWRCNNGKCEKLGTVTWHDEVVDARNKGKIFYYRAALGPAGVSEVAEANVLDCECR
jgi:hypothetical protein